MGEELSHPGGAPSRASQPFWVVFGHAPPGGGSGEDLGRAERSTEVQLSPLLLFLNTSNFNPSGF